MITQYITLSKCISFLNHCGHGRGVVLRLEVKLITAKRLLLNDHVCYQVKGKVSSEVMFHELYTQIKQVFGSFNYDPAALAKLKEDLDGILEDLERHLKDQPANLPEDLLQGRRKPILVRYQDCALAYVSRSELKELLDTKEIIGFKRSDGWVNAALGPLRGQSIQNEYNHRERRSMC